MQNKKGKLFVVSGPSGVGKTTVVSAAIKRLNDNHDVARIITYTSRSPRNGEVSGKDYQFISPEEFKEKIKQDFFLESTEYAGHLYGSPKPSEDEMTLGKSFVAVLDIEGAKRVSNALHKDAVLVWIAPPDMTVLKNRLIKRSVDTVVQIEKRLARAKEELDEAHKSRLFDYVLVNDIFEQAVEELKMLIGKILAA